MSVQFVIAGHPLDLLTTVGDRVLIAEFGTDQICGPSAASCAVGFTADEWPAWLAKGASALVHDAGRPKLSGVVTEVDKDGGSLTIAAASHDGDSAPCLSGGLTTSTPDAAIDNAIAANWVTWTRPTSIGSTALTTGDETNDLNMLSDLLPMLSTTTSRPLVDAYRMIRKVADPTTPGVTLINAGTLSWSSATQADVLVGRYADSASGGARKNITVSGPPVEQPIVQTIDLTTRGLLTAAAATSILNGILAECTAGGWTDGLTFTVDQVAEDITLSALYDRFATGEMIRNPQRDDRAGVNTPYVDVVIETATWQIDDETMSVGPRGTAAKSFTDILDVYGVEAA